MRRGCLPAADRLTIIDATQRGALCDLRELWRFRDLLLLLTWRDIRVRYRQTALGMAWAVAEPLVSVVLFTLLFNRLAGIDAGRTPYVLHCAAGLLVWTHFARALRATTSSLIANSNLATKVYFPRLILPLAAQLAALVDVVFAFAAYLALAAWCDALPTIWLVALPLWLLLASLAALGVGLVGGAINVRYRDVSQALPLLIQVWMFLTPVVYPLNLVPPPHRGLYALNPLVGIVEAARAALVPGAALDSGLIAPALAGVLAALVVGLIAFRTVERCYADIV
jgi:lipopolysaccharide transport system permease protein